MHAALRILSERAESAASPSSGSPAAGAVGMPGPGKSAAGSRLAKQTCAGIDSPEAGAATAVGNASAKQQGSEEGLMPDEAVQAPSIQRTDEAAAQGSAESAPVVCDAAALEEQQPEGRLRPDEVSTLSSTQEEAEAETQGSGDAESALVAGEAPPCERDAQEGLMPGATVGTTSRAQHTEAAAPEGAEPAFGEETAHADQQAPGKVIASDEPVAPMSMYQKGEAGDEDIRQSALAAGSTPADEHESEEVLTPDEAQAPASMQETARSAFQSEGGVQSALAAGSTPADEHESVEIPVPGKAQAPASMQDTAGSASQNEGGAQSASGIEDAPARDAASGAGLLPEDAMPVPRTQEAPAQRIKLQQSDAAQASSQALEPPASLVPAAYVSRKRDRPTDLHNLEETEKPARGSAARLRSPAHVTEPAQGGSGFLAESAYLPATLNPQAVAPGLEEISPAVPEARHGKAQVSAAERCGKAQDVSEATHFRSSGSPALQALPLVAPDALAANAANPARLHTIPGDAEGELDGPGGGTQAAGTHGVAPAESSAAAPESHVQNPQPLPQVDVSAHSADDRDASTTLQAPAHALGARKLASAELLCDEVLPEADFGLPWHEAAEAASDVPARANGRSRLGQPPSQPAATKAAGGADGRDVPEPKAEQISVNSTVMAEEAGATRDAAATAPGSAQQEAQPSPQGAGVASAAPEQDVSGQPSAATEASPRIAAALLEAGSRITVRAAKPRRTTVGAQSSAAAAPEATRDTVGAVPSAGPAHASGITEQVKALTAITVSDVRNASVLSCRAATLLWAPGCGLAPDG